MAIRLFQTLVILFFSFYYLSNLKSEELEYFSSYKNYHFANELSTWVQNEPFEECIAIQRVFFEWVNNPKKNRSSTIHIHKGDTWAKFRNKDINNLNSVMVFKKGFKTSQSGAQKFVYDTKKNNSGYIRLLSDPLSNIPKEKDLFKCFKKSEFEDYQNLLNKMKLEYENNVEEGIQDLFEFFEEKESFNISTVLKDLENADQEFKSVQEETEQPFDNLEIVIKKKPNKKSFNVSSVLKDLENADQEFKKVQEETEVKQEEVFTEKVAATMTISEIDLLRQQLHSCLNLNVGVPNLKDLKPVIFIEVNPDRTVKSAKVVNQERLSDPSFRIAAEAAMRAVNNPNCSPLLLPEEKYDQWKEINFTFDFSWMFENTQKDEVRENKIFNHYFTQIPNEDLKLIQKNLNTLGYYQGAIDGIHSEKTLNAIKNWIKDKNFELKFHTDYLIVLDQDATDLIIKIEEEEQRRIEEKEKRLQKEKEEEQKRQKEEERKLSIFSETIYEKINKTILIVKEYIQEYPQYAEDNIVEIIKGINELENLINADPNFNLEERFNEYQLFLKTLNQYDEFEEGKLKDEKQKRINLVNSSISKIENKVEYLNSHLLRNLNSYYSANIIKEIDYSSIILQEYSSLDELSKMINSLDNLIFKINDLDGYIKKANELIDYLKKFLLKEDITSSKSQIIIEKIELLENELNEINPSQINDMNNEIQNFINSNLKVDEKIKKQKSKDEVETLKKIVRYNDISFKFLDIALSFDEKRDLILSNRNKNDLPICDLELDNKKNCFEIEKYDDFTSYSEIDNLGYYSSLGYFDFKSHIFPYFNKFGDKFFAASYSEIFYIQNIKSSRGFETGDIIEAIGLINNDILLHYKIKLIDVETEKWIHDGIFLYQNRTGEFYATKERSRNWQAEDWFDRSIIEIVKLNYQETKKEKTKESKDEVVEESSDEEKIDEKAITEENHSQVEIQKILMIKSNHCVKKMEENIFQN